MTVEMKKREQDLKLTDLADKKATPESTKINIGFSERSGFIKKLKIRWIKGGLNPRFWWYRLRWHIYPKLHIVPRFPLHLILEMTNACNLRCVHCYQRTANIKRGFLDFETAKSIIDEAAKYHCPSLMVSYGGEIFLHKDAVKVIEYASSKKTFLELSIITNATLMTPEITDAILNTSLSQIVISIDALSKTRYEQIRVGANYDRLMENVNYFLKRKKELRRKKPIVRIQMVGMSLNQDEIEDFVKYWEPRVDMVTVNEYIRPANSTDDYSLDSKYSSNNSHKSNRPCSQLWQRFAVTANRELVLCNNEYSIGLKGSKSIFRCWHGEETDRIRKIHVQGQLDDLEECRDCAFRYF